jgi:ubiquinone/menaquinone biosynthesis C-methylase UbiE
MTSEGKLTTQSWRSYDAIAVHYDQLLVPHFFLCPAKDLVSALRLLPNHLVLDVGTGSGAAALQAVESIGSQDAVVGIDPSLQMLRRARDRGLSRLVAGQVPGLPFANGAFDGVLANFVISHIADYQSALADMVRTLRPGGKLGITAWQMRQNEFIQLWRETAALFVREDITNEAMRQALPWEDWFADPDHFRNALENAGLESVEVRLHLYEVAMSVDEYLAYRENSMHGRCNQQMLDWNQWECFREQVAREFRSRFDGPVKYDQRAHIAIGSKPILR